MPRWTRKRTLYLLCTAVIAAVALFGYGSLSRRAQASSEAAASAPPPPKVAATVLVSRRNLQKSITLTSELKPYDVVNLYAKVAGYLKTIDVDYGSRVSAGETIATLELPEQQSALLRSQAAYNLARVDYERLSTVAHGEPGLIAQVDVDKAHADYEMAKDQRDEAAVMVGYGAITVPFDGIVTKRYADPGALIAQGTNSTAATPIVQIADTYRLRMVVETPESIVSKIHDGLPVAVKIQSTGETIPERVARYSYDVHEDTRTMHTEVDVPNPDLHLKPGMYASVTLDLEDRRNVVAIPTQALVTDPSPNVWVVDDHDTIREQPVTVGLQTPDYVQVTSGLRPGEKIFIGDRSSLTVGTRVTPKIVATNTL